jgi:hypothetical protein
MAALVDVKTEIFYDDAWHDISADVFTKQAIRVSRGIRNEGSFAAPGRATLRLNNGTSNINSVVGRYSPRNPRSDLYGKIGRNTPIRQQARFEGGTYSTRFVHEVVAWPVRWDLSETEVWVPLQTSGMLRRLGISDPPLLSAPRRFIPTTNPVAYWALADSKEATRGIPDVGDYAMLPNVTPPKWAGVKPVDWLESFPTIQSGTVNGRLRAAVDAEDTGRWVLGALWIPRDASESSNDMNGVGTDGTRYGMFGTKSQSKIEVYRIPEGESWSLIGTWDAPTLWDGNPHWMELHARQSGSNIVFQVRQDGVNLTNTDTATLASATLPKLQEVRLAGLIGDGVGHFAVWNSLEGLNADITGAINGWQGETAVERAIRLCYEQEVDLRLMASVVTKGLVLPGARSDYATTPNHASLNITGDLDIRCELAAEDWTNNPNESTGLQVILTKGEAGAYRLAIDSLGRVHLAIRPAAFTITFTSTVPVPVNSREPIAVRATLDVDNGASGRDVTFYTSDSISGTWTQLGDVVTISGSGNIGTNTSDLFIGNNDGTTNPLAGVVVAAEVRDGINGTVVANPSFAAQDFGTTSFDDGTGKTWTAQGNARVGEFSTDSFTHMGPQFPKSFMELLTETAKAEAGAGVAPIITEARDELALKFTTRESLYNMDAGVELNYAAAHVDHPFEPTPDDQGTANDVTVKSPLADEARAVLETGALSVLPPPDGVGRYGRQDTINVLDVDNLAGWWLHLGTWDEDRYPAINVNLRSLADISAGVLSEVVAADTGARLTVDNPPLWMPPEQIDQLIIGYTEEYDRASWKIGFHTVPHGPYRITQENHDDYGYIGSDNTETKFSFVAGTDTVLAVVVIGWPDGAWTDDDAPFDIMVAGVRLTVTAIVDAAGDIEFTVTQAPVNGITKTIPVGTKVELFHQSYIGL